MASPVSVGDVLAVSKLIIDTIASLRDSSSAGYRQLVQELYGLERAIHELEHLPCAPAQRPQVDALRVAALGCKHILDDFVPKLRAYRVLELRGPDEAKAPWDKARRIAGRPRWGFSMEDEVRTLRAKLAAHIGYLSMRIVTLGLQTTTLSEERAQKDAKGLTKELEDTKANIITLRQNSGLWGLALGRIESILRSLSGALTGEVVPQLKTLIEIMNGVWATNSQVIGYLSKAQQSFPAPDARFSWLQAPLRLEDSLGRIIPVPAEYDWNMLNAVVRSKFATGPGRHKVAAGDYALFPTYNASQTLDPRRPLEPGSSVSMAIVIGKYGNLHESGCPRPGCGSQDLAPNSSGGFICNRCSCWFHSSPNTIPPPLRFVDPDYAEFTSKLQEGRSKTRLSQARRRLFTDAVRAIRNDRERFRIVRIAYTSWLPDWTLENTDLLRTFDAIQPLRKRPARTAPTGVLPRKRRRIQSTTSASEKHPEEQRLSTDGNIDEIVRILTTKVGAIDAVIKLVADSLHMDCAEVVKCLPNLSSLGVDSLCGVQLAEWLHHELEIYISVLDILNTDSTGFGALLYTALIASNRQRPNAECSIGDIENSIQDPLH